MNYTREDIKLENISPKSFENLCYDLLVSYNFEKLIWRKGGADSGRDIEGYLTFNNSISNIETKWFFECKHYSKGVPPVDLNSKIAWADAENPDYLVFFISSYITTGARVWLEKIASSKTYKMILIEGDDLINRLIKYPKLIEDYFSLDRYEKLFKETKDSKAKFNINPSFELLKEIIENIDLTRLDEKDFSFILFNFYGQFQYFESRNDHFGDFDESIVYRILDFLVEKIKNTELLSFEEYKLDFSHLDGQGMLDEIESLDHYEPGDEISLYNFQHYILHLNPGAPHDRWKIGEYLVILYKNVAFELFEVDDAEIRIIKDFDPNQLTSLSLGLHENIHEEYEKYVELCT